MEEPERPLIRARLVERNLVRWRWEVSGAVEASIEYKGAGAFRRVLVDGKPAAGLTQTHAHLLPSIHLDFTVGVSPKLPARLYVEYATGAVNTGQYGSPQWAQLVIGGVVVWEEKKGVVKVSPETDLPIPASPQRSEDNLPLPATAPEVDPAALPIPDEGHEAS